MKKLIAKAKNLRLPKVRLTQNVLQILLTVGGLTLVSFGIGLMFVPAGVIAGGVSLLLLERGLADE
jgi:uncharacterized membrane-anchored protein YitT (DUF2179 family)